MDSRQTGLAIGRGSPRTVEGNGSVNRHYRAWGDREIVGHLGPLGRFPPFNQTFSPIGRIGPKDFIAEPRPSVGRFSREVLKND